MTDKAEKKAKSFSQYHDEIEALKLERIALWREVLGPTDTMEDHEAQSASFIAENNPKVLELAGKIAILRREQLSHHEEPEVDPGLTEEESDQSHVAHGHAPRFGTIAGYEREVI